MTNNQREALESAGHELTTLNGLMAFDSQSPIETFPIDTKSIIEKIDMALSESSDTCNHPS